jgi:hypothetical protein
VNAADRDVAGRFRPGSTGNPNGRPKAPRGVDAAFAKALAEKIAVTEQGKRKRKSRLDVTATQVANKGASGDLRAAKLALDQARKAEERAEAEASRAPAMTETDREIAARIIARLKQMIQAGVIDDQTESRS